MSSPLTVFMVMIPIIKTCLKSLSLIQVLLLCSNYSCEGLEEEDKFPVTYIVSSKDNLTVLTTVTTEDDWREYVKNNKIGNIYMDVRGDRCLTILAQYNFFSSFSRAKKALGH